MSYLSYPIRLGVDGLKVCLQVFGVGLIKQQAVNTESGGFTVDRRCADVIRPQRPYRHRMGQIFNFCVRLFAIGGFYDTQCGFKGFKGFKEDTLQAAIPLFEKRASHAVFHKERKCKEKFDQLNQ